MRLRLGPLPAAEGRVWTADTLKLFDAVDGDPCLPFALPVETLIGMRAIVEAMGRRAASTTEGSFTWECDTTLAELKTLITYWLNLGKLSERTLASIGGRYSGAEGERFHTALLDSLLAHLRSVDPEYAARLRVGWGGAIELDDTGEHEAVVDLRPVGSATRTN